MLLPVLHSRAGYRPDGGIQVEFDPTRASHFGGAGGAQNEKLQRPSAVVGIGVQSRHKSWEFFPRHRRKVPLTVYLALIRQQGFESALPRRGIVAATPFVCGGEVED